MNAPEPIHIDLRDLTDAHIEEALPGLGLCSYAAPCIIGTLIPAEHRAVLDGGDPNIETLVRRRRVTLPDEQLDLAVILQVAFDHGDQGSFLAALAEVRAALSEEMSA